jgi:hypothetical protein
LLVYFLKPGLCYFAALSKLIASPLRTKFIVWLWVLAQYFMAGAVAISSCMQILRQPGSHAIVRLVATARTRAAARCNNKTPISDREGACACPLIQATEKDWNFPGRTRDWHCHR